MGRYFIRDVEFNFLWEIIPEENFVKRSNEYGDKFAGKYFHPIENNDEAIHFWKEMGYEVYREEPEEGDLYVIFETVNHGILGDSVEVYGIYNEDDMKEETVDYMQFHDIEIPNEEFDGLQMWIDQGFEILICKEM